MRGETKILECVRSAMEECSICGRSRVLLIGKSTIWTDSQKVVETLSRITERNVRNSRQRLEELSKIDPDHDFSKENR